MESTDGSKIRLRERLRYWFDGAMARGAPALIGLLALASGMLIMVVTGLAILLAPDDVHGDPYHVLWMSLLRTLDPGTMGGDEGSKAFLGLMLTATIGGIFIVSALVGVLTTGLEARLTELRKGHSRVIETGHTVVLGWSDQIFTIIAELANADERERAVAVILADRDKVEMEEELRLRLRRLRGIRVVCRSGLPTEPADLEITRLDKAGVIILPAPDVEDPDIDLIKTLLALQSRDWGQTRPRVVAVISESTNMPAARLAAGPSVDLIDAEDITARLIVQSRRQPGLSAVYATLLSFDGDEVYLRHEPRLAGSTYRAAIQCYPTSALIGIRCADGEVLLNPDADAMINTDDEMIVLAADNWSIRFDPDPAPIHRDAIAMAPRSVPLVQATLILGWNDRGPTIVSLLDRYLPSGSTLHIAAEDPVDLPDLDQLVATVAHCDTTDRPSLDALEPGGYQHIIVLTDDDVSPHLADSKTLVTLLHLRDIKERGGHRYAIVSELNDDDNRRLAQLTRADDFVVGQRLISLLLTQLAQNQQLSRVFDELFDASGCDIYLKPAHEYLVPGVAANFATVVEAALGLGETAIGYRLHAERYGPPDYGVVLNPDKAERLTFSANDHVVVLAPTLRANEAKGNRGGDERRQQ